MKDYSSYFIGIPLPQKYQQDFEDLQTDISQISPLFKTTHPKTPHITVCYLDKQSQSALSRIAEDVKKYLEILKGTKLKVSGFGYFGEDKPRILFSDVQYPPQLQEFNKLISKSLSIYCAADNNLPFHPHVTVAWVGDPKAQEAFKASLLELSTRLKKVNWVFDIIEVVLYGVDSSKKPEYHEKLISIAVK
ncbi:MAG: RNA 2',3'-cyclic phosphodiesterase [Candidatus Daviesbacteria bacterium]|nr:RNA 2',3'-cyclic phosphodiesterase [Candidatus Daviesbacteria bacterium]